jgi:hypothetical protein
MTTITTGMTPTQLLAALNANFKGVGTTLLDSHYWTDVNTNTSAMGVIFPTTLSSIAVGMRGSEIISKLNTNFSNVDSIEDDDCDIWVDRFTIPLTTAQKAFYNEFYKYRFKVSSYFTKITSLFLYYSHDEQAAMQNVVRDAVNEQLYRAPLYFLPFYGFESVGGLFAGYLNGGHKLPDDAKITETSYSLKIDKDGGALRDNWVCGAHENASGKITGIYERPAANGDTLYVTSTDASVYVFGEDEYEVAFSLNGVGVSVFKDGVKVAGPTNKTHTGLPDLDFTTFARNKDDTYETMVGKIRYKVLSSCLTDAEQLTLTTDLRWFINNVQSVF